MDYEGNYFPDEEYEDISTRKRKAKKIRRIIFYSIIIIVYLILFALMFTNCEPDIYEEYVFSKEAQEIYNSNPNDFKVYEIFPATWMSFDGGIQVKGVAYTPNTNELELGIKYNKKYIDSNGVKPTFELRYVYGAQEKVFDIVNTVENSSGRYNYLRVSFAIDKLPLDDNPYINNDISEMDGIISNESVVETYKYILVVKYPEETAPHYNEEEKDEQSRNIPIYDKYTAIQLTQYK